MHSIYLFMSLGPWEIAGIAAVVLLLFGGRKIPELMRGLGKGVREFNAAKSTIKKEIEDGIEEEASDSSEKAKTS